MNTERSISAYKAVDTRRLYTFEEKCPLLFPLHPQRKLPELITKAKYIWKNVFYNRLTNFPDITFGKGILSKGKYYSFYHVNDHRIELARGQRDLVTLTHEMVHANGRDDHDIEFVFQEFKVLNVAFRLSMSDLSKAAQQYQLAYQPFID